VVVVEVVQHQQLAMEIQVDLAAVVVITEMVELEQEIHIQDHQE